MVSIVLPTYNGAKYLDESIESIINQDFNDWELIIVDDGSTDETYHLACKYADLDRRIQIIRNESNRKLPASLNIGFKKARGDFLTWTSDDNVYLKSAIGCMHAYLKEHTEISMVCTGMMWIDENNRVICENKPYCDENMYTGNAVGASFMYRREVYDSLGEYDVSTFCAEDYDYWLRILISGRKIGYMPGVYYLYREHRFSLTTKQRAYIERQTRFLFYKNLDWILNGIRNKPDKLMYIYNKLLMGKEKDFYSLKGSFLQYMPWIERNIDFDSNKKCILYGAGEKGKECFSGISDKVLFFSDKRIDLIGTQIAGVKIISPEEMIKNFQNDNIEIIISVGYEKQCQVIRELEDLGLNEYVLYSQVR